MSSPKPAINIRRKAHLALAASDPLLSKKVSAAKELDGGKVFWTIFFLADENI